ncbi:MAG: hypothetical protein Q7R66_10025, partial [Undibacterium sp.]|uniref:hypothetical protein n=1 Tax=Undibacterium sp. TaxID=1914977 RepID=UPI002728E838
EGQLAAALSYRANKICPAVSAGVKQQGVYQPRNLRLERPAAKEIAIYSRINSNINSRINSHFNSQIK